MLDGKNSQCQSLTTGKLGAKSMECSAAFLGAAGVGDKARRATGDQRLKDLDAESSEEKDPQMLLLLSKYWLIPDRVHFTNTRK